MSTETSYLSSDLSNQKFSYDLVVGTTAEAINSTLKMYLFKNAPAPKVIWYGQTTAGGAITPMQPIEGVDPFAIESGGTPPANLLDSNFVFAIKAGFGLPPGVSPLDVPDILILSTDSQKVHYNMFFNTFNIVTLDWGRHGSYAWNNYSQPSGSPYIFSYQVDLNFNAADPNSKFSDLPKNVRQQLLNYNTSTMFSVQQLYMDLNNAGLESLPQIKGVPSTSKVYVVLQSDFINTYWKSLSKSGEFVLGYAVHSNSQPTSHISLQPTSLNFMVVPHYDAEGKISTNNKLYTLNYLMDTNNRKLTVGGPFTWNWVKTGEENSYHGAMAVRREVFAEYLINAISPYLSYICIAPTTRYTQSNAGFSWSGGYTLAHSSNQRLIYAADIGSKVADFSFTSQSHHSDKSGLMSGHFNLDSSASASISITGNEITVVVNSGMNISFSNGDIFGVGDVSGYVGGYTSTAIFIVSVDASGKITVIDKSGYPTSSIKPAKMSEGALVGIDGVSSVTDKLKAMYKSIAGNMDNFSANIETYLNSTGGKWIFPGGQTFLYKDIVFSENQDLVTHITYADPVGNTNE